MSDEQDEKERVEKLELRLAKTGLHFVNGRLTRTDENGDASMNLGLDQIQDIRVEKRFQWGGLVFLVPGVVIGGFSLLYADQGWVKIVFHSIGVLGILASLAAFSGSCIVVKGVGGQTLDVVTLEDDDQVKAFVFSLNEHRRKLGQG